VGESVWNKSQKILKMRIEAEAEVFLGFGFHSWHLNCPTDYINSASESMVEAASENLRMFVKTTSIVACVTSLEINEC